MLKLQGFLMLVVFAVGASAFAETFNLDGKTLQINTSAGCSFRETEATLTEHAGIEVTFPDTEGVRCAGKLNPKACDWRGALFCEEFTADQKGHWTAFPVAGKNGVERVILVRSKNRFFRRAQVDLDVPAVECKRATSTATLGAEVE